MKKITPKKPADVISLMNANNLKMKNIVDGTNKPIPITADEIRAAIKTAVKKFGSYNYGDKGPREVMDMAEIISRLSVMEPTAVADVLAVVREMKDYGEDFVSAALVDLQDVPGLDAIYEDERISDLF